MLEAAYFKRFFYVLFFDFLPWELRNKNYSMANITEREAGKTASQMMQNSLLSTISAQRFKSSTHRTEEENIPLSKSKGLFRMQKNNPEELRGIFIKMGKHGFIQNYGVKRDRRGGIVHRRKPRSVFYSRKSHPFNLRARDFIDTAVTKSGAVEYLEKVLGDIKTDKVITAIKFGIGNE